MLEFGRRGSSILQSTADYSFSVLYPFFFLFSVLFHGEKLRELYHAAFFLAGKIWTM